MNTDEKTEAEMDLTIEVVASDQADDCVCYPGCCPECPPDCC